MTARPGIYQSSWNAGELDPQAHGSTQLKPYYSGAARLARFRPIPQGGFTLGPGTKRRGRVPLQAGGIYKIFPFSAGPGKTFAVVLTEGRADIWKSGWGGFAFAATITLPFTAGQLADVTFVQRDSTMFCFHEDVQTVRIVRATDTSWTVDNAPFTTIPDVDYGGTYTNVSEQWTLYFNWPSSGFTFGTQSFEISVSGETTSAIDITSPSWAACATAIQAALIALPSIGPGVTVTAGTPTAANTMNFLITFDGADNAGERYDMTARVVSTTSMAAQTSRTRRGQKGGEPIMSVTRGWPANGIFFQDRLLLAGFKSKPNAFLASRSGEYFDLNVEAESASGAILVAMDTEAGERITHLARGRHLLVFTSDSEWYLSDRALARSTTPNLVRCSGLGTSRRIPVVEQEDAVLFVNKSGTVVNAAIYSDVSQGYKPTPISLLSSPLIDGVTDVALRTADAASDSDSYWIVRADGSMAVGHLLRDQDVIGFTPWSTDGAVKAVAVDGDNVPWIVVQRVIGGVTYAEVETLHDDCLFDAALDITQAPSVTVGGLSHLEGATVWCRADGYILGPFTVTGASITIDEPVATISIGRWQPPDSLTLPQVKDVGPRRVIDRPARVHTVKADVIDTESIAIGANARPARDVPLARFGDPVDAPLPPYTGKVQVGALLGFSRAGQVQITQVRPGKLTIRNLTMEARL